MGVSKEHTETFYLRLLEFCKRFFLLFPEEAYFSDWICLLQPIPNIIYSHEDLRRLNTRLFSNGLQDLIIFKLIFKYLFYFFILVLLDIISKLFDKFIQPSASHTIDDAHRLFKFLSMYDYSRVFLRILRLFSLLSLYPFIYILYSFKDTIIKSQISVGISVYFFTCPLNFELFFSEFKDITDHMFDTHIDGVVVVALIELVAGVEDVVDYFDVFRGVTDLIVDDTRLVHKEIVVYVDVLCAKIKGISSEIVQFIHIDSVQFVADELKLPRSLIIFHSTDQCFYSLNLVRGKFALQFLEFGHVLKYEFACSFMRPFLCFAIMGDLGYDMSIEHVTIGSMTDIMKKPSQGGTQNGFFLLLFFIEIRMVVYQGLRKFFSEMCCADGVLKPGMCGGGEDILQCSQLLDFSQSLEMWSIDKIPYNLREIDETVNGVIDLSFLLLLSRLSGSVVSFWIGFWYVFLPFHVEIYLQILQQDRLRRVTLSYWVMFINMVIQMDICVYHQIGGPRQVSPQSDPIDLKLGSSQFLHFRQMKQKRKKEPMIEPPTIKVQFSPKVSCRESCQAFWDYFSASTSVQELR